MVACADKPVEQKPTHLDSATTANVVDTDTAETAKPDYSYGYFDPSLPPAKPKAELDALNKIWRDALEADRKWLVSERLEDWMKGLKDTDDEDGMPVHGLLTDAQFASLTTKEKLGYAMFHPEGWSQNCAEFSESAGHIQAISRMLPYDETGDFWSDRQMDALRKDSVAVKKIILECISTNNTVSIPMMHNISEFKVWAAIPKLIEIYNAQTTKDDLLLTTMIALMERASFWKWINSDLNKAMVGDENGIIALTPENAQQIIDYAQKFAAS
jgi:hypothetical protein